MTSTPFPVEIALGSGVVLRGLEYAQDGPPVVLVHDVGDDADSWGRVPAELATKGFRAVSIELRGHGLSDGEVDLDKTLPDLEEALGIIEKSFGPVGLVAYGSVATVCLGLGPDHVAPVQVLVSPLAPASSGLPAPVPAMRAIFAATGDHEADTFVRSSYQRLPGQNMWFSTGGAERGVDLLTSGPHMVEQLTMFLRRYLIGHHLAWIGKQDPAGEVVEDERTEEQQRTAGK